MIDTLTLHGGPADGVTYPARDDESIPAVLQLSIRMPYPDGRIEDLPHALIRGEVHAVRLYRHTGDGNYQYQQPTADGHVDCWGAHNSPDGPVDCDGRPI